MNAECAIEFKLQDGTWSEQMWELLTYHMQTAIYANLDAIRHRVIQAIPKHERDSGKLVVKSVGTELKWVEGDVWRLDMKFSFFMPEEELGD